MYEILVANKDGVLTTWDIRHTKEQAEAKAIELRRTLKRETKIVDRDYKRPPKEDWRDRRGGRRDRDDDE